MKLLAIDPGNKESGYVIIGQAAPSSRLLFEITEHGNIPNFELLKIIQNNLEGIDTGLVEMIQSYGMSVGETVFDTCRWIGKFELRMLDNSWKTALIKRKEIVNYHCSSAAVKNPDSLIRKRMIEKYPKESKGVTSHAWQALGLATMYLESQKLI
jgi:hypothetical protein